MNAKELHDLYAPLHAAVPETRPTFRRDFRADAVFTRRLVWDDDRQGFAAELVGSTLPAGAQDSDGVFVDEAAALCRTCALEWAFGADESPDARDFAAIAAHVANRDNAEVVRECLELHRYNSAPIPAPPSSPQPPHPPA